MLSIQILLFSILFALYVALAIVLIRKYIRTRDVGFIWLGVAIVVWPFISRLLDVGREVFINRLEHHRHFLGFYPSSLVEHGRMSLGDVFTASMLLEHLIGMGLLLVAVLYLCKAKGNSNPLSRISDGPASTG